MVNLVSSANWLYCFGTAFRNAHNLSAYASSLLSLLLLISTIFREYEEYLCYIIFYTQATLNSILRLQSDYMRERERERETNENHKISHSWLLLDILINTSKWMMENYEMGYYIAVNKLDKLYIITTFETIVSIYYYYC